MNNVMGTIMSLMQGGQNPQALVELMIKQNPALADAWKQANAMTQGKSEQEIKDMVEQFAKQQGLDVNQVMKLLGR